MIKVWNALTDVEQYFSTNAHDAASAVAYCYREEHKMLSTYFYHFCTRGRSRSSFRTPPMTYGRGVRGCGTGWRGPSHSVWISV